MIQCQYNRAKYVLQPVCNVKGFGAKGDGVTDDTAAIQGALDYAIANNLKLFIPPGTYIISDTITISALTFHIEGAGYAGLSTGITILKSVITDNNKDIISINANHSELDGSTMQGIKILGSGQERHGIYCSATPQHNNLFRDIYISRTGGDGWHFEGETYMQLFENCFGDHCYGWGFYFEGGQTWATGNRLILGQSSFVSCWAEFCDLGCVKIIKGLDPKWFGGQLNGKKRLGNESTPATFHVVDTWGIDVFGANIERGTVGFLVEGITIKPNLYGGRIFNQSQYSIKFNQSEVGGSNHAGGAIYGTMMKGDGSSGYKNVYFGPETWGAVLDGYNEDANNANYVTFEDNGFMNVISPRILATLHADKFVSPKFGDASIKLMNWNNKTEHLLIQQRDGIIDIGYNTPEGNAQTYPLKIKSDIVSSVADKGFICVTPDGTKMYRISVDNTGAVITTQIT